MKKILILGIGLIMSLPVLADGSYQRERIADIAKRKAQLKEICGEAPKQSSQLFGGPDNYGYFYPDLGVLAAELESVKYLDPVIPNVYPRLRDAAEKRYQLIIGRDLNRRLHKFSEKRYETYGFDENAKRALSDNEKGTAEGLSYITSKALQDANSMLADIDVWVPKSALRNNGGSPETRGVTLSDNMLGNNDYKRKRLTHYRKNSLELLNECRDSWSRIH